MVMLAVFILTSFFSWHLFQKSQGQFFHYTHKESASKAKQSTKKQELHCDVMHLMKQQILRGHYLISVLISAHLTLTYFKAITHHYTLNNSILTQEFY